MSALRANRRRKTVCRTSSASAARPVTRRAARNTASEWRSVQLGKSLARDRGSHRNQELSEWSAGCVHLVRLTDLDARGGALLHGSVNFFRPPAVRGRRGSRWPCCPSAVLEARSGAGAHCPVTRELTTDGRGRIIRRTRLLPTASGSAHTGSSRHASPRDGSRRPTRFSAVVNLWASGGSRRGCLAFA